MSNFIRLGLISLFSLFLTSSGCSLFPKKSNPLLGTWVSDKERTLQEIEKKPEISAHTQALLNNDFFGKMKITYYPDTYESEFEGEVIRGRYKILEMNDTFIEIEENLEGLDKSFRSKLFLDGDYLVVYSSRHDLKEYFRKIN